MTDRDLLQQIGKLKFQVQELDAEIAKLADPVSVHANMLSGKIAKPSFENIKHMYADDFQKLEAAQQWQPIETAQKIFTANTPSILVYHPFNDGDFRICTARMSSDSDGKSYWHADIHSFVKLSPTHWMPLPKAPK